jgi:hypothetical protein
LLCYFHKQGVMAAQGFFPPTRYYSIDVECVASGTGASSIALRQQRSRTEGFVSRMRMHRTAKEQHQLVPAWNVLG